MLRLVLYSGLSAIFLAVSTPPSIAAEEKTELRGRIVDAASGQLLPARLYIQGADGQHYLARSTVADGAAIAYQKQRPPNSVEIHTALSAHPFIADLPLGKYTLTAERGKEYLSSVVEIDIAKQPQQIVLELHRWIDMADHGWYSGETHVHRSLEELPTAMLADDLNVALPLTSWVTRSHTPPAQGDKNSPLVRPQLIEVDPTHVIYPMNTEYEIFSVREKRHTLGAVFVLNHKSVLELGAPPVGPIAEQARREGALLELDKHNWPWSMMLVPVMNVDLYELTNNHVWRTEFAFRNFGEPPAAYMNVEQNDGGWTEKGWLDFTFENYYALLNCGFRLRPTAGTATGVHPVPLGYGRVYVHLPEGFSYDGWLAGLDAGRSFVTTGPLLDVQINGQRSDHAFSQPGDAASYRLNGWAASERPLATIEVLSAGKVMRLIEPQNQPGEQGGFRSNIDTEISIDSSTWLAVRCYEPTGGGRVRFAHTAPFHIDVAEKPLRPRAEQAAYLIERVEKEIARNQGVLTDEELGEFRAALARYRKAAQMAP